MKIISYSLFGYRDVTPKNCFEFHAYLRGLMVNIRMNRLLYPGWTTHLCVDEVTYKGEYKNLFDALQGLGLIVKVLPDNNFLCTKMLWRLHPVFEPKYKYVICRDLDSVATYREAQAVQEWINEKHTIHCITDSISHNIPMMGGMIGFHCESFISRTHIEKWDHIESFVTNYNMNIKGADQKVLNDCIYSKICHSATEHFVKGMNWNKPEKDGRHYSINEDIAIPVDPLLKASNYTCGHIGSAGYYELELFKFLREFDLYASEYKNIEQDYSKIFYWASR